MYGAFGRISNTTETMESVLRFAQNKSENRPMIRLSLFLQISPPKEGRGLFSPP